MRNQPGEVARTGAGCVSPGRSAAAVVRRPPCCLLRSYTPRWSCGSRCLVDWGQVQETCNLVGRLRGAVSGGKLHMGGGLWRCQHRCRFCSVHHRGELLGFRVDRRAMTMRIHDTHIFNVYWDYRSLNNICFGNLTLWAEQQLSTNITILIVRKMSKSAHLTRVLEKSYKNVKL